ncbi:aminotransferase class I/II-fold pyridoxal phosphate-dependent enzyme [Terasakiella sp.]|uniref:aminotransferase class I/II-fold pyridoxal phosphate-dependent enzyme n=1 Tax=Terasakiella sp. TaxID=2034861 RepID=UPI003AA80E01
MRKEDIAAVCEVLTSQFLTTGPKVPELEDLFAQKVAANQAVACSNGTTALHLASMAIGLKPGDKVIVPALTFLATANAVRMCGADVVFCDVVSETGLMTLDHIREAEARGGSDIVARYRVALDGMSSYVKSVLPSGNDVPLLHLFQILIDYKGLGKDRAQVMNELSARGVGTQVHYIPVSDQPYYQNLYGVQNLPGARQFYERVLALPLYCGLSDSDVEDILEAVRDVLFR